MSRFIFYIFVIVLYFIISYVWKELQNRGYIPPSNTKTYSADTTTFHIAGVTFKDGRLKRQAALRKLKFHEEPMTGKIVFTFKKFTYQGDPAVQIVANGRILGNVPANIVDDFISKMESSSRYDVSYNVVGGGNKSYGCILTVRWYR